MTSNLLRLLRPVLCLLTGMYSLSLAAGDDQIMLQNFRCDRAVIPAIFKTMQAQTGVDFELKGSADFIIGLPELNMDFDRIPATAVIQIICFDAGLDYTVSGKKITFEKAKNAVAASSAKVKAPGGTRMTIGHVGYYPVGWTTPKMVVQNGSITVIGPTPKFRKVTSGVDVSTTDDVPPPSKPAAKPAANKPVLPDDPATLQVLKSVMINNVRLQDVSLDKAINELRSLSRSRSSGQAVNIYLSAKVASKARLTMTLDKLNLHDSLSYVCRAAGVKMLVLSWGVVIIPT